jgi:signal transduction histidine kinase
MRKITLESLPAIEKRIKNLTLHQRVALFTGSVLVALGSLLILFINLVAPLLVTREIGVPDTMVLVETVDASGAPITVILETPAPGGYTILHDTSAIRADPLTAVRFVSLVGLVIIGGLGFLASRWLARTALRPIAQISQTAKRIDSRTLGRRLNYPGPQDEVKDLADAFDAMLDRLEANFERQGQFATNLAHELRTPLTSMRMNIEALKEDPGAVLQDYKELTDRAERALTRLEEMVEDLLLLAKGEKEIAHQPIVLGALLEEILDEAAPIAQEHSITLNMEGETDCEIWGDAVLLECAFSNLVENGIRYNHPGGFVEIFVRREAQQAVIEVRDNGIGIADDDQAKIFERFYRARQGPDSRYTGRGLGLAIVKHAVELHYGNVEVESKLGLGSTFCVFLPSSHAV